MGKKKKGTISRDSLAIVVAVILILAYIFVECYSVSHIELETQTALTSTVYETIDATALVIRNEKSLVGNSEITVPSQSDGAKVNVGGIVSLSFSSNEDATKYAKYVQLQQELEYYEALEAQTVGHAGSVESINSEINEDIDSYIQAIASGNAGRINASGDKVNDAILRRQMIIGQSVDLVSIIQKLRTELQSYASVVPSSTQSTEESGVFSSYDDGCDELLDYSKATEMTVDDIEASIKAVQSSRNKAKGYGKLVTSYKWYLVCVVDADSVNELKDGMKVDITFKNNSENVLTMKIVSGAQPSIKAEKTALILECSRMNSDIARLRIEEVQIRLKEHTGFKVPASALHVVDGKKGVYALISSQIKFREASVVYSCDDYLILSFDSENQNGIRLYDKIILQGKDLEDGRVYT